MFTGMLLMSSFTAQISSTITTDGLRPLDEDFGYKIGIPNGSRELFRAYCEGAILKPYDTEVELLQGLQDDKVAKIWLFDCNDESDLKLRIVLVFPVNPVIGAHVELVEYRRNLQKYFFECLDRWAEEEHGSCYEEQVASKILKKGELECPKSEKLFTRQHCFEKHHLGKYLDARENKPPRMDVIGILLCSAAALLITLLATGALWNSCLKSRRTKKSCDNVVDKELAVGTQELQPRAVVLKREESATGV